MISDYIIIIVFIIVAIILKSPKFKGIIGEKSVSSKLKKLDNNKYKVINDLMIKNSNRTSQIDHIVISEYGIFVIETKNYKGWIIGNEYDDYWKQVIYKRKEKLRNPIKQNYGHVKALENYLKNYENIKIIPIVVFTYEATLKVNAKSSVIYTKDLLNNINSYKDKVISKDNVDKIYSMLSKVNIIDNKVRKQHVKDIRKEVSNKEIKVKNNICPKCNSKLVLRKGKYGDFYGCENFPKCRFTKKI